ncbi:MAG: hypothetical protein FWE56_03690 [Candidatus Bathyarchaeota archaeon]|nr:hypothetical protein [Candidatus Termiticorpusculum sp.]MCL2868588.1 hypothetical protein [Candidatus Termiticorpusculum sp.]
MSKGSKVLDIVFHPAVFAVAFLACLALAIINLLYSVLPHPWGMLLLIPLVAFGFLGYLVDEWRYK